MKYVFPAAIAIGVGLVVLLTYLIPDPSLVTIRHELTDIAVILAGFALILGIINLLISNARRVSSGSNGWFYSLLTIIAVLFTLAVGIYESFSATVPALYQPDSITQVVFKGVIYASLASLSSLVLVFLVLSAMKMLREKPNWWSLLFLAAMLVALIGWIPLRILQPVAGFRAWLLSVPVTAGTRGILLGVALGAVVIGIRVLTGVERPYKD